jgi:hypothetical protein
MGLRLPGPRAARGSAVVNGRTWKKTCGGHVINRSKNSWLSLCVLGCIRFGNKDGVVVERLCHQSDRDPAEGALMNSSALASGRSNGTTGTSPSRWPRFAISLGSASGCSTRSIA